MYHTCTHRLLTSARSPESWALAPSDNVEGDIKGIRRPFERSRMMTPVSSPKEETLAPHFPGFSWRFLRCVYTRTSSLPLLLTPDIA